MGTVLKWQCKICGAVGEIMEPFIPFQIQHHRAVASHKFHFPTCAAKDEDITVVEEEN